jgi:cytoskeletal protein CcmA (bactofilin family)/predicted nucleic-acid-binding Zn-ribbon protein
MKPDKVLVACPKCGHTQHEPASAYSSVCKKCRQYFRVEEVLKAAAQAGKTANTPSREFRHVTCFQCGTELEVSPSAQSTMCKRCSSHLDLRDYIITNAVSKNFRTRGRFVVEEGGYVFNTETFVADAIIKGRFHGKLIADYSLEIHRTAEIKGSFKTGKLIIPVGCVFRWPEAIAPVNADISGELIANVKSTGKIVLRSTARLFGNVEAGALEVEPGAVVVGTMQVGQKPAAVAVVTSIVQSSQPMLFPETAGTPPPPAKAPPKARVRMESKAEPARMPERPAGGTASTSDTKTPPKPTLRTTSTYQKRSLG